MKIEVGKTYKSNVASHTKPGIEAEVGRRVPEEWVIVASYPVGNEPMFVGRREAPDGVVLVREFDEDGKDGTTKTGNARKLLPNTRTVVAWGITRQSGTGSFFLCSQAISRWDDTVKGAEAYAAQANNGNFKDWVPAYVTYQVEE